MPLDPDWTGNNVTEVAIQGHWGNGRPAYNIVYVRREEDDPEQSARDVLNNWQDHMMEVMAYLYTIDGARYRDRNSNPGVVGFIGPDVTKNLTGQNLTEQAPPNTSWFIKKTEQLTVGQRTGRMYVVGVPEASINGNGELSGAQLTAFQTAVNAFFSGLSGAADNELVVPHFVPGSPATPDVGVITGLTVAQKVATQRRRLRK